MFNETRYGERNGRILAEVVAEINEELKGFPRDRAQMLISELRESVKNSKSAALWGRPAASRNGMAVAQPRASWTGCRGILGKRLCLILLVLNCRPVLGDCGRHARSPRAATTAWSGAQKNH